MESGYSETCGDKAVLVTYLYDECDAAERQAVDAHLAACEDCAQELDRLRGVRSSLADWAPPEPAPGFQIVPRAEVEPRRRWFDWRPAPAWGLAAAAVLVFSAGAAVANLQIRYGSDGLVVRTGWSSEAPAAVSADEPSATPWRGDLTTLEAQLRREFSASRGDRSVPVAAREDVVQPQGDLLQRVRQLIEESERRQQRDLALRFAQLMREGDAQREADLFRIEQQVGQLEGLTEAEVVQHREIMDYLVRVAGR